MTTPKNKIVPGTVVIITDVTNDSNIMSNKVPVYLMSGPGTIFDGAIIPSLGQELEIVSNPKKIDGINVVKVKFLDKEYFTYYCSLRYMTKVK